MGRSADIGRVNARRAGAGAGSRNCRAQPPGHRRPRHQRGPGRRSRKVLHPARAASRGAGVSIIRASKSLEKRLCFGPKRAEAGLLARPREIADRRRARLGVDMQVEPRAIGPPVPGERQARVSASRGPPAARRPDGARSVEHPAHGQHRRTCIHRPRGGGQGAGPCRPALRRPPARSRDRPQRQAAARWRARRTPAPITTV